MGRQGKQNYTRLTEPLVRDNGVLRPASWDEALDRAAEGFRRNRDLHGPDGHLSQPDAHLVDLHAGYVDAGNVAGGR